MTRTSRRPSEADLAPEATVLMLSDVPPSPADGRALRRFVERGGRAILIGEAAPSVIGPDDDPPRLDRGGPGSFTPGAPVAEVSAVDRVESAGAAVWRSPGRMLVGLGDRAASLLVVERNGSGRIVALADATALDNAHIQRADNAALALALVGEPSREILVIESPAAFTAPTGLAALPLRWKWALGGLLAATLTWLVAVGRRLGPPEQRARDLAPARALHAEALGAILARTRDHGWAGTHVQARSRALLVGSRAGPDVWDRGRLVAEAELLGLSRADALGVVTPVTDDTTLLASARALAQLERRARTR